MSPLVVVFRISRISARLNRAEVIATEAQILQRGKALGSTWMADKHRPEHSDCVGIEAQRENHTRHFLGCRGANRPEVVVTAGQNVAKDRIIQNFSDVSSAEPCGSHCNWSTNSAKGKHSALLGWLTSTARSTAIA